MAVTYGFFNSVNGDRKYNADQMSEYFRGIVSQGVFQHLDSGLAVSAGTGLSVSVGAGRAIIQDRWIQNSAALNLTISAASETYGRKDAVVIRLDKSSRAISITVKTGTPAASPVAPSMTRNATTYEMALAYVNVASGASSVTVTDKRSDSSVCGWAAVAQATSGEVDQMLNDMKTGFDGVGYSSPAAMVQGEDQKLYNLTDRIQNQLSGETEYSNLYNKFTANLYMDVNSSTGELIPHASAVTSDFIEIDPSWDLYLQYATNRYYYAYDTNKAYLGYGTFSASYRATIGDTYANARYIRIQSTVNSSAYENISLMVYKNRTGEFLPYNLIDNNLERSNFLKIKYGNLKHGYLYANGVLNIIINNGSYKYKITGNSLVMCDDGTYYTSGLALNTEYDLAHDLTNPQYFTIVYDIDAKVFKGIVDYTGDYSNYIIFGYYMLGYIYGNMGNVLLNGTVVNKETEKALEDADIGDLSELRQDVDANTTAIGVNASSISSEASARALADTALGARIDNLVAPSGESIAEVTDARVGYNGTTYASLEARLNAEAGRVRNVLVVGTTGQYQTIASAVSAASNGDIIFIQRGVYEEHVQNRDKVLHIIGESKEEVIWKHANTNYGSDDCYDCGMGSIRNLTMWNYDNGETPTSQYGRSYCIHLDHQTHYQQNPPISNYFYCENVHFINDSNECLGLGLRNDMTMEFVNCDVETLSGNEAAFYVHAASAEDAKCIINGCKIRNNSSTGQLGALRVEGYNHTTGGCTAILERNIVVNLGTGPAVILQLSKNTVADWDDIPDWILDPCSLLNNATILNYS